MKVGEKKGVCARVDVCVCVCMLVLKVPSGVQCCVDPSDPESKVRGDLSSPSLTIVTSSQ